MNDDTRLKKAQLHAGSVLPPALAAVAVQELQTAINSRTLLEKDFRLAEEILGVQGVLKRQLCRRCLGCGQLANSDDREPWSAWESLPDESKLAVQLGFVRPEPCDHCGGSGYEPGGGNG